MRSRYGVRLLAGLVVILAALAPGAVSTGAQEGVADDGPAWVYPETTCDLERSTPEEIIARAEMPNRDLTVWQVAEDYAPASVFGAMDDESAIEYPPFVAPDAAPVSDADLASIQDWLRVVDACGQLGAGYPDLMTDDLTVALVVLAAEMDGLTVEEAFDEAAVSGTPEPTPFPEGSGLRLLYLAYQAWDLGANRAQVIVGLTVIPWPVDDALPGFLPEDLPPPSSAALFLSFELERYGDSWRFADVLGGVEPADVPTR